MGPTVFGVTGGRLAWGIGGLAALALVACSGTDAMAPANGDRPGSSLAGPRPTAPLTATTTPTQTLPTTTALRVTSTMSPRPTSTSTSTSTSTTTMPPPTTTEPARRRPSSELPRPDGFARFEPAPAWEGEAALTGEPADVAVTSRPALAVKVDNAPGARPQWNLADADLIIEENVEGITRFVAVYHSRLPDRIGPVRSARSSDLDILAGLNRPILAASGGNWGVTLAVRGAHKYGRLSDLSAQRSDCFYRSRTRSSPHDLLLDPICALESATRAGAARPVFERGTDSTATWGGVPDDRFQVRMDALTVTWVWDNASGTYLRRQRGDWHTDVDGDVVATHNVVVLSARHVTSEFDDESPHVITVGSGPAVVHRDGIAISATWSRDDPLDTFSLTADDGSSVTLADGTTFVELTR